MLGGQLFTTYAGIRLKFSLAFTNYPSAAQSVLAVRSSTQLKWLSMKNADSIEKPSSLSQKTKTGGGYGHLDTNEQT